MNSHNWTVLGLVFDAVGAVLLSVEAVTLENVRKLRDRLGGLIYGSGWQRAKDQARPHLELGFRLVGAFVCAAAVFGLLTLLGYSGSSDLPTTARTLTRILVVAPLGLVAIASVLAGLAMLTSNLILVVIGILDLIDRNTPGGTVGLIGMALLVLGFAFQVVGA
jgi:hypothetical protein